MVMLHERNLELGSGYHPTPGFTHLDANPNAPEVDVVGMAYPLPEEIADEEWDSIRAVDVLEHLSYRDTDAALRCWSSVLRPGGMLFVQVPDADTIMRWYVHEPERLIDRTPEELPPSALAGAAWRLLGGHADSLYVEDSDDWRWNAHYSLWSVESLTRALVRAGFAVRSMDRNVHPNLQCWAVKL